MSLVQEPLIGVINRRFVFCFYNAYLMDGIGDDAAARFFKENGGTSYGAIFTPDGECLGSFGFGMPKVYEALKDAAEKSPDHWWMTEDEQRILTLANENPNDLQCQVDAARLNAELLDFDSARKILNNFVVRTNDSGNQQNQAIAKFWMAHHTLAELDLLSHGAGRGRIAAARKKELVESRETIRTELTGLGGKLPEDLEDDRLLDLFALDLQLTPRGGFYTGWRFAPGFDTQVAAKHLESLIKACPQSNRIGQMYFLLGLALVDEDNMEPANSVWQQHIDHYPADRFSMLSRFHHTSYQFSPHRKANQGGSVVMTGGRGKGLSAEEIEQELKKLDPKRQK